MIITIIKIQLSWWNFKLWKSTEKQVQQRRNLPCLNLQFSVVYRVRALQLPRTKRTIKTSHMINFAGIISGKNPADDKF